VIGIVCKMFAFDLRNASALEIFLRYTKTVEQINCNDRRNYRINSMYVVYGC
jgi:hypothetical protein